MHLHFRYRAKVLGLEIYFCLIQYFMKHIMPKDVKATDHQVKKAFTGGSCRYNFGFGGRREEGDDNRFILLFCCKGKAFKSNFINFQSHSPILMFLIWGKEVLFSLIFWGQKWICISKLTSCLLRTNFGSLMLPGYLLGTQMFILLTNRIRSGNYILSRVENKGVSAWLHNKWQ